MVTLDSNTRWLLAAIAAVSLLAVAPAGQRRAPKRLIAIFVVDGLRPDSINATDTPTIARLRDEGVEFTHSHSIFPTETRVNAAALVSGAYPSLTGIVANTMVVAGLDASAPLNTGDVKQLLALERIDRVITTDTLGEILQRHGKTLVTLSSGTTGGGFVLNSRAAHGAGIAIHGQFDRGRIAAYPAEASDAILERFGSPPAGAEGVAQMTWTDTVLRDYVLPDLAPDVIIDWMGPLDSAQHANGAGSPAAKAALRAIDASLDLTLKKMDALGLARNADVFVLSDHGFAQNTESVNVDDALVSGGLKTNRDSRDLIVVGGQAALFYVADGNRMRIDALVRFLQQQPWTDVVFSRGGHDGQGQFAGTFSLDAIHGSHPARQPDVIASLAWTSEANPFGVPGTQTTAGRTTGPVRGGASSHGGLSPWVVHNTFVAAGPDFKRSAKLDTPVSMADVAPTILSLLSIDDRAATAHGAAAERGRILRELLKDGPRVAVTHRTLTTAAGSYRASIELSAVDGHEYVDSGSRVR